jgi:hypothetical protein
VLLGQNIRYVSAIGPAQRVNIGRGLDEASCPSSNHINTQRAMSSIEASIVAVLYDRAQGAVKATIFNVETSAAASCS